MVDAEQDTQLEFQFFPAEQEHALRIAAEFTAAIGLALQRDPEFHPTKNTVRVLAEQREKLVTRLFDELSRP